MQSLTDVHGGKHTICTAKNCFLNISDVLLSVCWDPASLYLVSAGGGDRHVRVWHNLPGRRLQLQEMRTELVKASSDALKVGQFCLIFNSLSLSLSLSLSPAETAGTDRGDRVSIV